MSGKTDFLNPSNYELKEFIITNALGDEVDIEPLILGFSLTSNLYVSSMLLNAAVYDATSFWRDFKLNGQEKVKLTFKTKRAKDVGVYHESDIELTFYIVKIENFSKRDEDSASVTYDLVGIEEHIFRSKLSNISKSASGEISEIIKDILVTDLSVNEENLNFSTSLQTAYRGVLPWRTPLKHCDFLRKRLVSKQKCPAFLFSSIVEDIPKITLKSLTELKSADLYDRYIWAKEYSFERYSDLDYREQQIRILDLNSKLGFSRFAQASNGAFSSNNNFFDLIDGSLRAENFDYLEDGLIENQILEEPSIFQNTDFPLNKFVNAHRRFEIVNSAQNSTKRFVESDNYLKLTEKNLHHLRSQHELLSSTRHDFRLFGDINMQPGNIIELNFPTTGELRSKDNEIIDTRLSGNYLVTGTVHNFAHDKYFVHVKAQREANPS